MLELYGNLTSHTMQVSFTLKTKGEFHPMMHDFIQHHQAYELILSVQQGCDS